MSDKNSKETSKLVNTLDVVHTEVYSSLAYHNFPEGSINHPNIMKATIDDIPRIRTWVEFRRHNEHEDLEAPCLFY